MPSVTIFNVIFPVFAIALAGYLLARLGVLRPPDVAGLATYDGRPKRSYLRRPPSDSRTPGAHTP